MWGVQPVQPHRAAAGRCVDKTAFADINARMGARLAFTKHHQIAGAQAAALNRLTPSIELGHRARRRLAGAVLVDIANQAAAIETAVGRVAAVAVGCANQAQRVDGNIARLLGR